MVVTAYVALLRKQADSDFGVEFPDFPGCITAGVTLEDAQRMAAEALLFHVEGLIEDGNPIPEPSRFDEVTADPRHSDAAAVLVNVPTAGPGPVRVSVSVSEDVLQTIDRVTDNHSRFLAEVVQAKLHPTII